MNNNKMKRFNVSCDHVVTHLPLHSDTSELWTQSCEWLNLWARRSLRPAVDRFLSRTEADGSSSHCPSPSPPAGTHVRHSQRMLTPTALCVCVCVYVPARTSGSACCSWCNVCRWCSSASRPGRSPASHTASAATHGHIDDTCTVLVSFVHVVYNKQEVGNFEFPTVGILSINFIFDQPLWLKVSIFCRRFDHGRGDNFNQQMTKCFKQQINYSMFILNSKCKCGSSLMEQFNFSL